MLDPLLYRWGVPPVVIRCVHWTMQMWVLQTWIKALGLYIVMPKQHAVREILCSRIKLPTSRFFNGTNSDPQPASRPASGPFG